MSTIDNIKIGKVWENLYDNTYLQGKGVEAGDQLVLRVIRVGNLYVYQGDSIPDNDFKGDLYETGDLYFSVDGEGLWVRTDYKTTELLVRYAP